MQNILVIGAGRSAISLIEYLLDHAEANQWRITIADANTDAATKIVNGHPAAMVTELDANDDDSRRELISKSDLVISMLPAFMHFMVAKDCLKLGKHLITPSYISEEMRTLEPEVKAAGLIFLNELGVDPGIDHMSAMRMLDE